MRMGLSVRALVAVFPLGVACARSSPLPEIETQLTRPYLMGFSIIPPKPDINVALRSMEMWTRRADAAIMHMDVPWALLLEGKSPAEALKRDDMGQHLREKPEALTTA